MLVSLAAAWLSLLPACPPLPERSEDPGPGRVFIQQENLWAVAAGHAPPSGAREPAEASLVGQWQSPEFVGTIAIHATMLPDGRVLHYSYPQGTAGSLARVFDPVTGEATNVNMETDIFCSGHTQLADGRVFVSGGNDYACEFQGRVVTNIFDSTSGLWTSEPDMIDGRWYPSNMLMPDGSVLIFSGLATDCERNPFVERFVPGQGLTLMPHTREIPLYPRMHILSSGRIAHVGPQSSTWTYRMDEGWTSVTSNNFGGRWDGTSVLLPGETDRIMLIGGSSPLTNTCEIIDFSEPTPSWSYAAPLNIARAHLDALILPDKTVLVMGGGQDGLYGDPVNIPELYDPEEDEWTMMPEHVHGRMYHATTVLLPDARVLVAGQDSGPGAFTAEIYEPAYLFRGPRPSITSGPVRPTWGWSYDVQTPDAETVDSVVLVKLTSVTHSVNFQQRLADLAFTTTGTGVRVTMPPTRNVAPPGHYMLFLLNAAGVPSEATIVRLDDPIAGDADGDGVTGFADLVLVLAGWGPCGDGPCSGDLDADGQVGFVDVVIVLTNWTP